MATAMRQDSEPDIPAQLGGTPWSELSRGSFDIEQGDRNFVTYASAIPSTSTLTTPITHILAGAQLPISARLSSKYGINGKPIDSDFLTLSATIRNVFEFALNHNYLSADEIERAISVGHIGSPEQSRACFKIVNKCLGNISDSAAPTVKEVLSTLESLDFTPLPTGDWEFDFTISTGDPDSPFEQPTTPVLIAQSWGVCVIAHNILDMPIPIRSAVSQLIYFCCSLSQHATTLEMIEDDMTQWMCVGDVYDVSEDDQQLLIDAYVEDAGDIDSKLRDILGENECENLYVAPISVAEYFFSLREAKKLSTELNGLSKDNLAAFIEKVSHDISVPSWITEAAELLLKTCHWDLDMNEALIYHGDIPSSFMKPFGFGFPLEDHLFTTMHESSMHGEESCSLSIPLDKDTHRVLANLDIGEKLLLFIDNQLAEYFEESK